MDAYRDFSSIYDHLMQDVDYDAWCDRIEQSFRALGVSPKLVLELGCGTGNLTVRLAKRGYSMIGLDLSSEMLSVAAEKSEGSDILYLLQDMTEFELYGTVDAVVCSLDCLNYLTDPKELQECFSLVSLYLNPDGVFVFDLNSPYKLEHIIAPQTFVYEDETMFYTWQSEMQGKVCEFDLTFFVREEGERYRRFEETHFQRAYAAEEICAALRENGLTPVFLQDGLSGEPVSDRTERFFFAAQKKEM